MIIKMIIRSSQDEQPAYFYTKLLGFFFFFHRIQQSIFICFYQSTTIKITLRG